MFFLKSSNIHCFILFSLISIKSKTEGTDFFLRIFHIHCFILFSLICKKTGGTISFSKYIYILCFISFRLYVQKQKTAGTDFFQTNIHIH